MPRQLHRLNVKQVAAFEGPGLLADGGNLYLRCDGGSRRSWQFVFKSPKTGRQRAMGLGSAGIGGLALSDARGLAAAARDVLRVSKDPIDVRDAEQRRAKAKQGLTFGRCADTYVEAHAASWRNAKHKYQWAYSLTAHCAAIRSLPIEAVDTEAVLRVLRPIWETMPETATRLRGRIELVLDAARTQGLRSGENPAAWRGHLRHLLSKPRKLIRGHLASMPYEQVPAFITRLAADTSIIARMLRLTILTAARGGEVRGLLWPEVDFERRMLVIPGPRMKAGKEHKQPLSDAALSILVGMRDLKEPGCELVFPSRCNRPFSQAGVSKLMDRHGASDVTIHGFRSSFRMWAAEQTSTPHEVIEMCLAHNVLNAVERAYQRSDLADRRRTLLEAWARYCEGGANVVVHIGAGRLAASGG